MKFEIEGGDAFPLAGEKLMGAVARGFIPAIDSAEGGGGFNPRIKQQNRNRL
jgi:hypothetical protein